MKGTVIVSVANTSKSYLERRALVCPKATSAALLLQLQPALVIFQEFLEVFRCAQQPRPLLVIERDRETAQAVNADPALFANTEFHSTGAFTGSLLFEFGNFGF